MKKYTASYSYTNPNFVIQNLVTNQINADLLPILCVVKNILQRGFPAILSKYLQSKLGAIHKLPNFEERFLFATNQMPVWNDTISKQTQLLANNQKTIKTLLWVLGGLTVILSVLAVYKLWLF